MTQPGMQPVGVIATVQGQQQFLAGLKQMQAGISALTGQLTQLQAKSSSNVLGGLNLGSIRTQALVGAAGVTALGSAALATGLDFNSMQEQAQLSFKTILKSEAEAKTLLQDLVQFALTTPFELKNLIPETQRLLAYGIAGKDVIGVLRDISDAASGLSIGQVGIDRIVRALGQIQAKGRVQGDELLQLAEAGINGLQAIAEFLGMTTAATAKLISKGGVDAKTGIDAIRLYIQKRFGGLAAEQAKTFSGIVSNIKDTFQTVVATITGPLFARIKTGLQEILTILTDFRSSGGAAKLAEDLKNAGDSIAKFVSGLGLGAKEIALFASSFVLIGSAVAIAIAAFVLLNPALLLILASVVAVSAAIAAFPDISKELAIDAVTTFAKGIETLADLMKQLVATIRNLGPSAVGIVAVAGAVGLMSGAFTAAVPAIGILATAILTKLGPGSQVFLAIAAITFALGKIKEDLDLGKEEKIAKLLGKPLGEVNIAGNIGPRIGATRNPREIKQERDEAIEAATKKAVAEREEADAINSATKASRARQQQEQDLTQQIADELKAAADYDAKLKELSASFVKGSEAAAEIDSVFGNLKLFGEIDRVAAEFQGLTAVQAGMVQGFDAVARQEEHAKNEAFNFVAALSTVAQAFRESAAVGNQIVMDLARNALEAANTAASALFSRPTREQADFGVDISRERLRQAQRTASTNPQLEALHRQLDQLNRQLSDAQRAARQRNRDQQRANEQARRQREAAKKQQEAARRAADAAADAQLDAMKLANLQAQIAYERQNAALEKLIDQSKEDASKLRDSFLKSNEDLQQQINEAIGKGDSGTALKLVDQQRAATKAYRTQSEALTKNQEALTQQQKQLKEAEEERQRAARLAEALAESQRKQQKAIEDSTTSTDDNTDATDENTTSVEEQTQGIEDQKTAIEDQIKAIEDGTDAEGAKGRRLEEQLAILQAETDLRKAQTVAADKTLLTGKEQQRETEKLIKQISFASGVVRDFAKKTGENLIKEIDKSTLQFNLLSQILEKINKPGGLDSLLDPKFDPKPFRDEMLNAGKGFVGAVKKAADLIAEANKKIENAIINTTSQNEAAQHAATEPNVSSPDLSKLGSIEGAWGRIRKAIADSRGETERLNGVVQSIKPVEILPEGTFQEMQEITGEVFTLGSNLGLAATQASNAGLAADGLRTSIDLITPPDIADAGLLALQNAQGGAEQLDQAIDGVTSSEYEATREAGNLWGTLRSIHKPDVGDAGRGEILGALDAAKRLSDALRGIGSQVAGIGRNLVNAANNLLNAPRHAQGGIFTTPTLGIIGEAGPEVVLPLNDPERMKQLLAQISGATVATSSASVSSTPSNDSAKLQTAVASLTTQVNKASTASAELVPKVDNTSTAVASFTSQIQKATVAIGQISAGGSSTGILGQAAQKSGLQATTGSGGSNAVSVPIGGNSAVGQALASLGSEVKRANQRMIDEFKRLGLQYINFGDGVLRRVDSFPSGGGLQASGNFAVGTTNVPRDMLARIHRGEMIIPASVARDIRTFMDGRSGDSGRSSLSGRSGDTGRSVDSGRTSDSGRSGDSGRTGLASRSVITATLPTSFSTASAPSTAVFAPNITVTGETLNSMEMAALNAVRAAFRDARVTSIRGGGSINQGLGPSR